MCNEFNQINIIIFVSGLKIWFNFRLHPIIKPNIYIIIYTLESNFNFFNRLQPQSNSINHEQLINIWNSFNFLRGYIVNLSASTEDDSIKTNAYKMFEILILSFSSPGEYKVCTPPDSLSSSFIIILKN